MVPVAVMAKEISMIPSDRIHGSFLAAACDARARIEVVAFTRVSSISSAPRVWRPASSGGTRSGSPDGGLDDLDQGVQRNS
jgi:hypothetical protein